MRGFDGYGYEWRVEILREKDLLAREGDSNTQGFITQEFEMFWGSQYEWSSMLPIAWKLCSYEDARIKAPSLKAENLGSWWTTPVHLLGLGLGWTDIGKGLYEWGRQMYPADHPILKFVFNTWGPSIEALEHFMRERPYNPIESALVDLRDKDFETFRLDQPAAIENGKDARNRLTETISSNRLRGKRSELAYQLLNDDFDPFHLTSHFPNSVWPNEDENSPYFMTDDFVEEGVTSEEIDSDNKLFDVTLPRYAGFHVALNAIAAGYTGEQVHDGGERMRVSLDQFGFLGEFVRHEKTKRWFMNPEDIERGAYVHMWGN